MRYGSQKGIFGGMEIIIQMCLYVAENHLQGRDTDDEMRPSCIGLSFSFPMTFCYKQKDEISLHL